MSPLLYSIVGSSGALAAPLKGMFAQQFTADPPAHITHSNDFSRSLYLGLLHYIILILILFHDILTKKKKINVSTNRYLQGLKLKKKKSSSCFGTMFKESVVILSKLKTDLTHDLKMTLNI